MCILFFCVSECVRVNVRGCVSVRVCGSVRVRACARVYVSLYVRKMKNGTLQFSNVFCVSQVHNIDRCKPFLFCTFSSLFITIITSHHHHYLFNQYIDIQVYIYIRKKKDRISVTVVHFGPSRHASTLDSKRERYIHT